jgi:hypothetical protein
MVSFCVAASLKRVIFKVVFTIPWNNILIMQWFF